MSSLRDFRSDIELILKHSKQAKDTRIVTEHLEFLINKYRARGIHEDWKRNKQIDTQWLQDFGRCKFTVVNSADDPAIPYTSIKLSKFTIPPVVQLPFGKGIHRVAYSSKQTTIYPIQMSRFFDLDPNSTRARNNNYYFQVGNALYISARCDEEVIREGNVVLILDNPLEGFVIQTEDITSGNLIVGLQYIVTKGQVIHNSIAYVKGNVFTAVNTVFTGNGLIENVNQKRPMTIDDTYPMSATLAEYISQKIFGEFAVEEKAIASVQEEGQDTTSIRQAETTIQ